MSTDTISSPAGQTVIAGHTDSHRHEGLTGVDAAFLSSQATQANVAGLERSRSHETLSVALSAKADLVAVLERQNASEHRLFAHVTAENERTRAMIQGQTDRALLEARLEVMIGRALGKPV